MKTIKITVLICAAVLATVSAVSEGQGIYIAPYLQNVGQSKMTIMWETTSDSDSTVEYGPNYEYSVHSSALVTMHEMEITGLDTQTSYNYRVKSGAATSNPHVFTTAPYRDTPFRFSVYGDSRSSASTGKHRLVADAVAAANPGMHINTGDVVCNGSVRSQWKSEHFEPMKNLSANVPTYIAIGNHEYHMGNYHDYVSQPGNELYYAYTYGNSRFIVLDSNQAGDLNPGGSQHTWFVNELESAECQACDWTFVSFHHPLFCEGLYSGSQGGRVSFRDDGNAANGKELQVLFEEYDVTAVFQGHVHTYEYGLVNDVHYIIAGGGGCSLDNWISDSPEITVFEKLWHYCVIDIDGTNKPVFQAIAAGENSGVADGTVIHTVELPEPATMCLLGIGGIGVLLKRRRKSRA